MYEKKIYLRLVEEEDKEEILSWRNNPITIKNSTTIGKVKSSEHNVWFNKKIKDTSTHLFIINNESFEKIGIIFFNKQDNQATISININPYFRGQGYGFTSLFEAVKQYFNNFSVNSIVAEIKENNSLSLKIFKRVGFKEETKEGNLLTLRLLKDEINKMEDKNLKSDPIKVGMKLWSINFDLYPDLVNYYREGKIDYLELLYIPGQEKNIEILIENKIPIIVHSPSFGQKVLFAQDSLEKSNAIIQQTFDFAQKLNANKVIVHPDIGEKEIFLTFLKENCDKKMIIENMPKIAVNDLICLGYSIDEMKEFLNVGNFAFCLDFGHAIKSAISQNIDYRVFLKKMIDLEPEILHICGGHSNIGKDEHLNLDEGDFDLKYIIEMIKLSTVKRVTFEVPKSNGLKNYFRNIEYFRQMCLDS